MSEPEAPSREEFAAALEKGGATPRGQSPEASREIVAATHAFVVEQVRLHKQMRPFSLALGGFLTMAYSLVFVFGMRAARFMPGAARHLSIAALVVMPARVAVAAVDLAIARSLQPEIARLGQRMVELGDPGVAVAPAELEQAAIAAGSGAGWIVVGIQAAWALGVVLLFSQAWRYFGKPEVQELYGDAPGA